MRTTGHFWDDALPAVPASSGTAVLDGEVLEDHPIDARLLEAVGATPREANPVLAYLARLSLSSSRTMRGALEKMARFASGGHLGALDFPWWLLGPQHADAIHSWLAEHRASATANKALSAMKGVLESCWRLGHMTADEGDRASDVAPVRGTRLPPGRSIPRGELNALFETVW